ncbi:MAG: hypothetical protein BroJett025_05150 [Patescibacteria group bacterium]|nr:MAG: hypothetical protein BroJett025_05150 [Patescibacteria group bacterium]
MLGLVKKNTHIAILVVTLLAAFIFRTIQLAQTPSGFHADEASFYINAVSLSQTGMDEDGNKLPLSLASLIDPKPALYSYLQIPFLFIFDNQVFAARFASAVLSILSLGSLYLLIKEIADKKIALLITIVLSISPWHVIVSRGTQEVITSFFFLVATFLFLVQYLKNQKKSIVLIPFAISGFLSMYLYHSAKIVLPLLILCFVIFYFKKTKEYLKKSVTVLLIIATATLFSLFIQESASRISAVSIFNDQGPQQKLFEQIYTNRTEVPVSIVRVFYNKVQTYTLAIFHEYTNYFSPEFLFFSASKPTRNSITDHGLLYLIELPLIAIGLYAAIKNKRRDFFLFVALLIISPIPASLTTQETPSLLRSFPMVISLAYFVAMGIDALFKINSKLIKALVVSSISVIYLWHMCYFALQYHVQTRFTQPWFRNTPYTKIAQEVALISDGFERIEVTNDLRPLYAYFVIENLISIEELQAHPYARNLSNYNLGKFSFNRDVCDFGDIKMNVLYIAEIGCREKNSKLSQMEVIKVISYDDNTQAYELLQVTQ